MLMSLSPDLKSARVQPMPEWAPVSAVQVGVKGRAPWVGVSVISTVRAFGTNVDSQRRKIEASSA
jgi:hypothetical protein